MAIGIYKITHTESGRVYVGCSVNITERCRIHVYDLNNCVHHSRRLQEDWDAYGAAAFVFAAVETVSSAGLLREREQAHLTASRPYYNGSLVSGYKVKPNRIDMTDQRFNILTVISEAPKAGARERRYWNCICDCGRSCVVSQDNLKHGGVKSCGCLQRKQQESGQRTHGGCGTVEHNTWASMLQRCRGTNPRSYKDYAGRGICVCLQWFDFPTFLKDMGARPSKHHSIERLDVNGNYEPGNCIWATKAVQANNTRGNRVIVHEVRSQTLAQWAAEVGMKPSTLRKRIEAGWPVGSALSIPVGLIKPGPRGRRR